MRTPTWVRAALSHPCFTGIARQHLGELIAELADPWTAQHQATLAHRRDGAFDPGAVRIAVLPGRGGLLGAELALGFVLRAGPEGEVAGVGGRGCSGRGRGRGCSRRCGRWPARWVTRGGWCPGASCGQAVL